MIDESWFNKIPLPIFIDNSVFRNLHFNFNHASFETLKDASDAGDIQIVFTDIVKGEFVNHAETLLRDEEQKLKRMGGFTHSKFRAELDNIIAKISQQSGTSIWQDFLTIFKPKDINSPVSWNPVFDDYFALRSPFSVKKKDEFPDAFNLKMLENLKASHLVILSIDGDYVTWAKTQQNVAVFSKVNDFTDAYLKIRESLFSDVAVSAFDNLEAKIATQLMTEYSDTSNYDLIASHAEIDAADVTDLNLTSITLEAVDPQAFTATVKARFKGTANLEISCPVIVYDSVDKDEVYLGTNKRDADVSITIEATINLDIDETHPAQSSFEIEDVDFYSEDFEVPDDWTTSLDHDDDYYDDELEDDLDEGEVDDDDDDQGR